MDKWTEWNMRVSLWTYYVKIQFIKLCWKELEIEEDNQMEGLIQSQNSSEELEDWNNILDEYCNFLYILTPWVHNLFCYSSYFSVR